MERPPVLWPLVGWRLSSQPTANGPGRDQDGERTEPRDEEHPNGDRTTLVWPRLLEARGVPVDACPRALLRRVRARVIVEMLVTRSLTPVGEIVLVGRVGGMVLAAVHVPMRAVGWCRLALDALAAAMAPPLSGRVRDGVRKSRPGYQERKRKDAHANE